MPLKFSPEAEAELQTHLAKYPAPLSAVIPALYIAQREFGYLSQEVMDFVADTLKVPRTHVYGIATFYTMFNKKPVGRHHVQICTNLTCTMMGAESLVAHLENKMGIKCGETTKDGRFTLTEVECLGACGTAPVMMINYDYHEALTPEKLDALLEACR